MTSPLVFSVALACPGQTFHDAGQTTDSGWSAAGEMVDPSDTAAPPASDMLQPVSAPSRV